MFFFFFNVQNVDFLDSTYVNTCLHGFIKYYDYIQIPLELFFRVWVEDPSLHGPTDFARRRREISTHGLPQVEKLYDSGKFI